MANAVQAVQTAQAASEGWAGVPWIIWSGLISAAVASGVAAFTTRASSKNSLALLKRQHDHNDKEAERQRQHDATQKVEDRKGTIRREVYTEAVEKAHELLGTIGSLSQRTLDPSGDADALQAFLKSNAKVWLVAEAEAAHLSRDLASQFSELFMHAQAASWPVRTALEPVRLRAKEIEHQETEERRLQMQLNDAYSKTTLKTEQERLDLLLAHTRQWIKELKQVQQADRAAAAPIGFAAFGATFGEMRAVQRSLCVLVSALRSELNLPRDDEEFLSQLKGMERRAWLAVNKAFGVDPPAPMPDVPDVA